MYLHLKPTMLPTFYGKFLLLVVCSQLHVEAFLFVTRPGQKTTHHRCYTSASICLNCERPGFYPEMYCNNVTKGDYCFTRIVHNSSGIFTAKGPADSAFCEANKYKSSLANPSCRTGNIREGTECIDCCKQYNCDPDDLYCNKHIIQDIHMPFTVTTPKTTPTVVTSTVPTTQRTTTPSTLPPARGGMCQVCVEGNGQKCGSASSHYCNSGENYCMNTLISDPKAGEIVVKKCADEVECKWNYWVDTLGDPKCSNVTGPQVDNACNYCCDNSADSVPCNQDRIPKHLSTFNKPQEVKQCITGNSNNQFQLETCPAASSYCLNEVRYDTTAKHPEALVIKRCAFEAECKGLWWEKTRKRQECLTQNFTGITDHNIVCTFCCVSENDGPCNGASVPDQIAQFTPVTTTSAPTTTTTTKPTTTSTVQTTIHDHGHHNTHKHTGHGHHHPVTETTSTTTMPTTTTTWTTTPSTTRTTTPTTTTTPAPITCSGNGSVVCEDDPKAHCDSLSSFGLCTHLQYNPDSEDIKFCPKTCNLCDKYCDYVLRTTLPPTTTPPPKRRQCKVCGDGSTNSPCDTRSIFLGASVSCPAGQDFCMTDIVHDKNNNEMIFKRCVDEQTCRNEWLSQTSDQDHCIGYPNVPVSGAFSCHFCCTSDSCNNGLLPDSSTFYAKASYR